MHYATHPVSNFYHLMQENRYIIDITGSKKFPAFPPFPFKLREVDIVPAYGTLVANMRENDQPAFIKGGEDVQKTD